MKQLLQVIKNNITFIFSYDLDNNLILFLNKPD